MLKTKLSHTIEVTPDTNVFEDKRTNARSIALPFDFPDGKHGVIILTRLTKFPWEPHTDLKAITLHFRSHD